MIEPQPESRPESGSKDMPTIVDPCLAPLPSDSTLILEPIPCAEATSETVPQAESPVGTEGTHPEPAFAASDEPDQTARIALPRNESPQETSGDPIVEAALSIASTDPDSAPEIASPIKPLSAASTQPIPILGSTLEKPPLEAQPTASESAHPKGLPAWAWAIGGAGIAVALSVAVWFIWGPGLAPFRSSEEGSSAAAEAERQPTASLQESPAAPPPQTDSPVTSAEVPAELRAYFDKATQGDAKAMHMLAVMYYNGLNVRQNREEGLKWYRKAAEAGSQAAQKELKQIESIQK
ncbi:MAG TPA: hypothetical protein PKL14_04080 [Holophaga sp.]|nr:hypothetical protein [Holophaga sp.]